ncbi:hypothetical protein TCON_0534 [Astathelohania contejeani]|uniref:Uncharacterized protein n=1 Tax=Astathelohania contejeani TaxID=164912 RepID=A0ABQ7I1D0_9MICR|nr:hypothetical protein TCON_0534 [Thelohania contejeani]
MYDEQKINEIVKRTGCTRANALEACKKYNGDMEKIIFSLSNHDSNTLYVGGKSGQCVDAGPKRKKIILYKDGMLVMDRFYNYSKPENKKLKQMLDNKEFDRSILGDDGDYAEVEVVNKEKECYENKVTEDVSHVGQGHVLGYEGIDVLFPSMMIVDEDGDILFKILINGKRGTVKIKSGRTISDFLKYFKKYSTREFRIFNNGQLVDERCNVDVIKSTMVVLK